MDLIGFQYEFGENTYFNKIPIGIQQDFNRVSMDSIGFQQEFLFPLDFNRIPINSCGYGRIPIRFQQDSYGINKIPIDAIEYQQDPHGFLWN